MHFEIASDNLDALYELVERECTVAQVQELLREYKPLHRDGIRIAEENKSAIIQKNLRTAVRAGGVPLERVCSLVREAEENGRQHIFLFKPRTRSVARTLGADAVSVELWGPKWAEEMQFPRFAVMPDDLTWADFRTDGSAGTAHWLAKAYARFTKRELVSEEEKNGEIIMRYRRVDERGIYIVRWLKAGLLEFRVPRADSQKLARSLQQALWGLLGPAVKSTDFQACDFAPIRAKMLTQHDDYRSVFRLGSTKLFDSASGTAVFSTHSEEDDLFAARDRLQAIQTLVDLNNNCEHLVVTWLKTRNPIIEEELRTVIGAWHSNQISIGARASAKAIDYVIERVLSFAL